MSRPLAILALVLLAALGGAAGCSDDSGGSTSPELQGLEVTADPSAVTGVLVNGNKRWDFTITLHNVSGGDVTIEGAEFVTTGIDTDYANTSDTDDQQVWDPRGVVIRDGGVYRYDAFVLIPEGTFSTGTSKRTYRVTTSAGEVLGGEVEIALN